MWSLWLLAAALAFVIYRWRSSGFAWREFVDALRNVDWTWLALALVLILATYVGRALRWEVMLRPLRRTPAFAGFLAATSIGFTAVVLFGRAGEPVRPYLIAKKEGVSFSSQIAAWVVERMLDLLMILIIFGVALTQVSHSSIRSDPADRGDSQSRRRGGGRDGIGLPGAAVALRQFRGEVQQRLLDGLSFLPEALARLAPRRFWQPLAKGMQSTRSASFTLLLVLYTVLEWTVIAGCFYCVFRAFPATAGLGVTDIVIVLGFVAFGSVVQIPGVGGGMQIVTVLVLTEFYGVGLACGQRRRLDPMDRQFCGDCADRTGIGLPGRN